jgi:hypothetical protein
VRNTMIRTTDRVPARYLAYGFCSFAKSDNN